MDWIDKAARRQLRPRARGRSLPAALALFVAVSAAVSAGAGIAPPEPGRSAAVRTLPDSSRAAARMPPDSSRTAAKTHPDSSRAGRLGGKASPLPGFAPPAFTRRDSLFLAAATGEPRFQSLRDSARRILIGEDTATLDYLLARRLSDQTPRQRHYVEILFKAISDSGRRPAAAARLGAALETAPDSLKPQLLYIGSELGDSAFLKYARRYLSHDSEEVRKNAVRSLGAYPSPENAASLARDLGKTRDLELAERLWALGRQKDFRDWPGILPFLSDSNLYIRELARRIVANSCGDWANVEKLAPADMPDDLLLEWILMADASPGIAAKIWVRKQVPRLSPARMKYIGSVLRLR